MSHSQTVLHMQKVVWEWDYIIVAVPGRNRTLFCCTFWSHYHVWSAVIQNFYYGWGSYLLCKLMNTWHIYTVHTSTHNKSSALQHFEHSNAIKIHNGIMFDFYPGLPHVILMVVETRRQWLSQWLTFLANSVMAMPSGCSLLRSAKPTMAVNSWWGHTLSATKSITWVTSGLPWVSVPVLSNTTALIW